jgi:hypothetical protein
MVLYAFPFALAVAILCGNMLPGVSAVSGGLV